MEIDANILFAFNRLNALENIRRTSFFSLLLERRIDHCKPIQRWALLYFDLLVTLVPCP